jgi:hypothetical protein
MKRKDVMKRKEEVMKKKDEPISLLSASQNVK